MNKITKILKDEFITGTKPFDWIFLGIGLLLQVVAIIFTGLMMFNKIPLLPGMTVEDLPKTTTIYILTAISGITGIISVVLCSRGKLSQYFFGYIQLFTYLFGVAIPLGLGGETAENIIYAVTMVLGIIIWIKQYKKQKTGEIAIKSKDMTSNAWTVSFISTMLLIVGLALLFSNVPQVNIWLTGQENPSPWLDSITTVVPLVGQMLMCFGYSDQWVFWFIEDIMSLIMFIILGNWIMVAQYIFWTANCVYGYIKWRQLSKESIV